VPKEKCKPIEEPAVGDLAEGMERAIDTSGCCPRVRLVCNTKTCKKLDCAPLDIAIVKGTEANCCPTQRCGKIHVEGFFTLNNMHSSFAVPPKGTCYYVPKYLVGVAPQIHNVKEIILCLV
jgi:hypothetical protein